MQKLLDIGVKSGCLLGVLLLAGCTAGGARSLLALEDEKAVVRQALSRSATEQRVEAQSAATVVDRVSSRVGVSEDEDMAAYLQAMANTMSHAIKADDKGFNVVLLQGGQANAFTPGANKIVINEGLLRYCNSEAQIAAVLAHEMAHALMRHPKRQRQLNLASKNNDRMIAEYTPDSLKSNLGQMLRLGSKATLNGMIRQQEMMADSIGMDIMVKAGYDPRELVSVLQNLRALAPKSTRLQNVLYGNHPLTIDREAAALRKIERNYAAVHGRISTPRYDLLSKPYRSPWPGKIVSRN